MNKSNLKTKIMILPIIGSLASTLLVLGIMTFAFNQLNNTKISDTKKLLMNNFDTNARLEVETVISLLQNLYEKGQIDIVFTKTSKFKISS